MSFISKDHFSMALKGVRRLLNQKVDRNELDEVTKNIVQPDWNETDESSKAYIQNKPFGEAGIEYVFADAKNVPSSGQAYALVTDTCEYELIPGNVYKVIINGDEKEIECVVPADEQEYRCLIFAADGNWKNSSFFQSINDISLIRSSASWNGGTASVKIIGRTQPIRRLSEKYIPNTIARMSDVDELIQNNSVGKIFHGTCNTSSAASSKAATVDSSFSLHTGAVICIYFTNKCNSGTITLNVNGTGSKRISLSNSTSLAASCWRAKDYVTFLYDGTYWNIISVSISNAAATTSSYGLTMLSSSVSDTSTSLAATPSAVKQAYDKANAALPKSGGTMTGNLILKGDPTSNLHAATKQYVDNAVKNLDIPEQVQADWNQNNSDQKDYIKNRPFYEYDNEVLVNTQVAMELYMGDSTSRPHGKYLVFEPGVKYRVYFDQSIAEVVAETSELLEFSVDGMNIRVGSSNVTVEYPTTQSLTLFKVEKIRGLKQLDEKFIPDTIARKSDIPESGPGGAATWSDLADKPVYVQIGPRTVVWDGRMDGDRFTAKKTGTTATYLKISNEIPSKEELIGAKLTHSSGVFDPGPITAIGDGTGCYGSDDYGILVVTQTGEVVDDFGRAGVATSTGIYVQLEGYEGQDSPTLQLAYGSYSQEKFNPAWLPDGGFGWEGPGGKTDILPESALVIDEDTQTMPMPDGQTLYGWLFQPLPMAVKMVGGVTCTVTIDGVAAVRSCRKVDRDGTFMYVLGNLALAGLGEDTGEDWVFFTQQPQLDYWVGMFTTTNTEYKTVAVSAQSTVVHQIEEKFIPDSIVRTSQLPVPAAAVPDAAGEAPTAAEFNALLAALRAAGYLATE